MNESISLDKQTLWVMWTLLTLGTKGYGSRLVILSTALQRAALTSSRQLRYEQAKHVDGLQSDGWILLKCFRSRVMAGSPWRSSRSSLKTKTPTVDRLDTICPPWCYWGHSNPAKAAHMLSVHHAMEILISALLLHVFSHVHAFISFSSCSQSLLQ